MDGSSPSRPQLVVAGHDTAGDVDTIAIQNATVRAAFALLTPEQMAEVANNRMLIEQAKGMLMTIYSISADQAVEMLIRRSQATSVELGVLARHLMQELPALSADERSLDRAVYDEMLRSLPKKPS